MNPSRATVNVPLVTMKSPTPCPVPQESPSRLPRSRNCRALGPARLPDELQVSDRCRGPGGTRPARIRPNHCHCAGTTVDIIIDYRCYHSHLRFNMVIGGGLRRAVPWGRVQPAARPSPNHGSSGIPAWGSRKAVRSDRAEVSTETPEIGRPKPGNPAIEIRWPEFTVFAGPWAG